ncbi:MULTISPECIES: hypothetical protein [Micromonospora]|uniref:DUF485 domain-containing protein n=1 Tax=Micromonospora chalcea TaxID=1874 RepID=A0ABX9Y1B4_MICCH|nr:MULTISPECIES: hypothetical protein [Micromonospora]ODB78124.1 hypothetical protein A8711_28010 [Micromonospora sp. II]RQW90984.1 hypothetical protein DLJ60_18850 [Micromonospora chalcea]RQX57927.1 hypothetical protein DLJ57_04680 [Micromonospora chalcea]
MNSDEESAPSDLKPKQGSAPAKAKRRDRETTDPERDEFVSDEEMAPGLIFPESMLYREKVRATLIVVLLFYLMLWGAASVGLIAAGAASAQELTTLLTVFVTPILPMFGVAMAFYFNQRPPQASARLRRM